MIAIRTCCLAAAFLCASISGALADSSPPDHLHWTAKDHARAADAAFAAVPQVGAGTSQPSMWVQLAEALAKSGDRPRSREAALNAGSLLGSKSNFMSFRPRVDTFSTLVRIGDAADADKMAAVDGGSGDRMRLLGMLGAAYAKAHDPVGVARAVAQINAVKQDTPVTGKRDPRDNALAEIGVALAEGGAADGAVA